MSYPNAAVMVWELAGRPRRETLGVTATPGVCAMCARHVEESAPAKKWLEGKSFTDPAHLRARSDRVCEGCAWAVTGKGMDQVRMWTIVARTDRELPASNPKALFDAPHLHFTSRADMRVVVDTLADPPEGEWVVSVAESGQKHSLPYAVVNRGRARWRVRMDALDVDATPEDFRHVFAHVCALRARGFSAEDIEHLRMPIGRIKTGHDLAVWQHHAEALAPWRSSSLMHLAVFLPNKEHLDEYLNRYPAPGPQLSAAAPATGGAVPVGDAGQREHGLDRAGGLVGPGADRVGDGSGDGDTLF